MKQMLFGNRPCGSQRLKNLPVLACDDCSVITEHIFPVTAEKYLIKAAQCQYFDVLNANSGRWAAMSMENPCLR